MKKLGKKRAGQSLIEVVMATIIAAMTTTAIFSVILSSFVADFKADKREAAAMALKQAQEILKSYVSAVPTETAYIPGAAVGRWAADSSGSWALAAGPHNLDSLVAGPPLTVAGQPAPTFRYTVTNTNCIGFADDARSCKTVVFTITFPDSQ